MYAYMPDCLSIYLSIYVSIYLSIHLSIYLHLSSLSLNEGTGPGMKGGPYKLLRNLRLWRTRCGDDGAAAIVST
jgi:hypothetical protein